MSEVINKRVNDIIRGVLQRCILLPEYKANIIIVSPTMASQLLDYLTALLGEPPITHKHPNEWIPPKYDSVYDYCISLCSQNRAYIPFGMYEGNPVELYTIGRVECYDGDTDSFRGEGTMNLSYSGNITEHVRVVVLGCITGTGMGVLVDDTQRVWLYNPLWTHLLREQNRLSRHEGW